MDDRVQQTQLWLASTYGNYTGFPYLVPDGITGQATFSALIWALQYEIGLTPDGVFGNGTLAQLNSVLPTISESPDPYNEDPSNIIYILQGSFWCKGISPGGFTGVFGPNTASAVRSFQTSAGVTADGIVRPLLLQALMNTDSYSFQASDDVYDTYKHTIQMGLNQYYWNTIGLIAPNGLWERKSQKSLIKAVQIEWNASPVDGILGNGTMNKAPTLSRNISGYTNSKRLMQWALTINGFYPGAFDGVFGDDTYNALCAFQSHVCLTADGICGKRTWWALLVSKGDVTRSATAFDTAHILTDTAAAQFYNAGYRSVGRYLTNTPGGTLNKALTSNELTILKNNGFKVFPIFQTSGNQASYFTAYQGIKDSVSAVTAAKNLGFPPAATIYFAVDYDVLVAEIEDNILPYFRSIKEQLNGLFNIGAYGPRLIITELLNAGLITRGFIADMSTGFTCNIGQKLPNNWAYDQFTEVSDSQSTFSNLGYDKCIASSNETGTAPDDYITYVDPVYPQITEINLLPIEKLYNYANQYCIQKAQNSNYTVNVFDTNKIVLNYLRQYEYTEDTWDILAGEVDAGFNQYLQDNHSSELDELCPSNIYLVDPAINQHITIEHFAVTLAATITYFVQRNFSLDRYVNAYVGWAGDMLQVGGAIKRTVDHNGENYFLNSAKLYRCIGYMSGETDDLIFYDKDTGALTHDSGFSYEDLVQDLDAYNISKLYNLNSEPIHHVLNDYYNLSTNAVHRYSIFEEKILDEFPENSFYMIAEIIAMSEYRLTNLLNVFFGNMFGGFNHLLYGEYLAQAVANKISYFKQNEPDED
ncbi:MAG: DUF1906 domain-containing protein [Lachnospiraceae bacterium]|nr:DUF1906 domain-containing protein [Lachnospiraceae bacterium]